MIDLALIDLTPNSMTVIGAAHWWSANTGGELHLLHDLRPVLPALTDSRTKEQWFFENNGKSRLQAEAMADEALGRQLHLPIHISHQSLLRTVSELNAGVGIRDLFVGAKGTGFLTQVLRGSHIITLTGHFDLPVIAVPTGYVYRGPVDLLVAASQEHALDEQRISAFMRRHANAIRSVEFISVARDAASVAGERAFLKGLVERFELDVPVTASVELGTDVLQVLKDKLVGQPAGMLMVQKGSRAWTDHLFRRFLVNDLVYDGTVPLIIVG